MLSKDICIKCRGLLRFWKWRDEDVMHWNKLGEVMCPHAPAENSDFIKIGTVPPDFCPYRFEHAISLGMKDA